MKPFIFGKTLLVISVLIIQITTCSANENLFKEARTLQRDGHFDDAIAAYKNYLSQPADGEELSGEQLDMYLDALLQLMNTYQSKGEPEACVSALQEVFESSPTLQKECLRDFYSVLGYALSRTENMNQAEQTTLKALTLPLHQATPERYFRDYAYAAAVFYSNPDYQTEVINWCHEALIQAQSCNNTSGQQWVLSMLGSLYKRTGNLNEALELFQRSIEEARLREDDLGVLNGLSSLVDLFLYWDIPEYADIYASEACGVEKLMTQKNPMVSAQTYINKARTLHQLGQTDSISFYIDLARELCESLPYNSGMVDIDLLESGVQQLQRVTRQGTPANRAKAYHQLAQIYLKDNQTVKAEAMLDSLYTILNHNDSPLNILNIDYKPILDHYMDIKNLVKVKQYVGMMLENQHVFKQKNLNYKLVEAIVDLQTGKKLQDLKIAQLRHANQRLWLLICIVISLISISGVVIILLYQRKMFKVQIKRADKEVASLVQKLNQLNVEKEKIAQEVNEFLSNKDNRQELETLTPYILKEDGEIKFRQCFELLYPRFLPRLREKVPSVSRREELLSMLIALKQDNKNIAEFLAIAPRSVLMLRHRFRQKIGMNTEYSLENFIDDLLIDKQD